MDEFQRCFSRRLIKRKGDPGAWARYAALRDWHAHTDPALQSLSLQQLLIWPDQPLQTASQNLWEICIVVVLKEVLPAEDPKAFFKGALWKTDIWERFFYTPEGRRGSWPPAVAGGWDVMHRAGHQDRASRTERWVLH